MVENYRIDFAMVDDKIAVELDGHDFHKTREQRTADAKRERVLTGLGWTVIRFTGSEIFQDVDACIQETCSIYEKISGKKTS